MHICICTVHAPICMHMHTHTLLRAILLTELSEWPRCVVDAIQRGAGVWHVAVQQRRVEASSTTVARHLPIRRPQHYRGESTDTFLSVDHNITEVSLQTPSYLSTTTLQRWVYGHLPVCRPQHYRGESTDTFLSVDHNITEVSLQTPSSLSTTTLQRWVYRHLSVRYLSWSVHVFRSLVSLHHTCHKMYISVCFKNLLQFNHVQINTKLQIGKSIRLYTSWDAN